MREVVAGMTSLHHAALDDDVNKVKQLIEAKEVDINTLDDDGVSALHAAVDLGHVATATVLLGAGAAADTADRRRGEGPLHTAAREERAALVTLLAHRCEDVNMKTLHGETALHIAATKGNATMAAALVKCGADVSATNSERHDSALHIALREAESKGHWKTVNLLVNAGAQLDVKNLDGDTPLHLLATKSAVEADQVKALVKKDEQVLRVTNHDGNTPLHIAAQGGHFKTIRIFLEHGASTDVTNNDGNTPLHMSAANGYAVSSSLLIDHDMHTLSMKNNEGDLPFQEALKNNRLKAVKMFLELYERDSIAWHIFKTGSNFHDENPIDVAIDKNLNTVCLALANSKLWRDFFYTEKTEGSRKVTPLRRVIIEMPEVARAVLDQCVTAIKAGEQVQLNFELIDDFLCTMPDDNHNTKNSSSQAAQSTGTEYGVLIEKASLAVDPRVAKENHPMMMIAETENQQLLDHPVVKGLLYQKWVVAVAVYYTFLLYYTLFLTLTTVFMVKSTPPTTTHNDSTCHGSFERTLGQDALAYCIYTLAIAGLVSELVQLALTRVTYFELHNLFDWFSYIAPILLVTPLSDCGTGHLVSWQWQLGVAALFVAYMNMLFFLRIIPMLGIYIMMIAMMLRNFLRFLTIMFLFLLAFAMCFYLLIQNQVSFSSPFLSIMKSCMMMLGDVDFGGIFHSHWQDDSEGAQLYFEVLTWTLYIFFLVFMVLIVMNLLTSLAVTGVESLQEDSHYKILALQIELSLDVEFAMPMWIRNKVYSNARSETLTRSKESTRRDSLSQRIRNIVNPNLLGVCRREVTEDAFAVLERKGDEDGAGLETTPIHTTRKELDNAIATKTVNLRAKVNAIDRNIDHMELRLIRMEETINRILELMMENQAQH